MPPPETALSWIPEASPVARRHEDVDAEAPAPCLHALSAGAGILAHGPLPGVSDEEGQRVPASLGPVCDAHVHVFPDKVMAAIRRWFEHHGWPVRYELTARALLHFLRARGVERVVALHYAHKPGVARSFNRFMAEIVADHDFVVGTATVFPGEPDAESILHEAFDAGLRGVKMHCHVQCMSPDDLERMDAVYRACVDRDQALVMHAGREPSSPAYGCDTRALCGADRVAEVLARHPRLRLCIPHLGMDELDAYAGLLERFDNLWLDTTMVLADYFTVDERQLGRLLTMRPDRILYGSDFPNIPYAWDRELKRLDRHGLDDEGLERLLWDNAHDFYDFSALQS